MLQQCTGNSQADSSRLASLTTAANVYAYVELVRVLRGLEGLAYDQPVLFHGEIRLERTLVDSDLAVAGLDAYAGRRALTPTRTQKFACLFVWHMNFI